MKKNVITLNEQELREIIVESVRRVIEEGIKINRTEKENLVTFDDTNDALVDGPTKGKFRLPNTNIVINTYSMFKRVGNIKGASDANPLLFSLKGKNNWTLTNPDKFWKRFGELVAMFIQDHPLEKIVMIPIHLQDERLTTKSATDMLIMGNVSRKNRKKVVDSVAATIILQTYLDRKRK